MNPILKSGATAADIAWAAGLFEGEGCIHSPQKRGNKSLQLSLRCTDRDVVEKFYKVLGIGHFHGPYEQMQPTEKPIWAWGCGGFHNVQGVIALFWAHLCERR